MNNKRYKFKPHPRKHDRGTSPCWYCNSGQHKYCRIIKLDGNFCSCSCPIADSIRGEVLFAQQLAKERGEPIPTTKEYLQNFIGNDKKFLLRL